MDWINIIIIIMDIGIFVLSGFLWFGKGGWIVAGWNILPQEKKDSYNKPVYFKLLSKTMFVVGIGTTFMTIGTCLDSQNIFLCGLAILLGAVIIENIIERINPEKYKK